MVNNSVMKNIRIIYGKRIGLKYQFKISSTTIVTILCIIILFIASWAPYVEKDIFGTDLQHTLLDYVLKLCTGVVLLLSLRKKLTPIEFTTLAGVLVYRAFNCIYAYDFKGLGLTSIAIGFVFCSQTDETRANIFRYFKHIMTIVSVLGIICFISYYADMGLPYTIIDISGRRFIDYKCCYFYYTYNGTIRFNGLFNEPGWFGTWTAFFLCADDLNLKKIENIILLISGMLTFSLAFVMLLIIYYVLKNLNDMKRWLWLFFLVLLYLFVLPHVKTGITSIDNILQRMVITSEGLTGDNRYGLSFEELYDKTIHSNKVFFGYGAGYAEAYLLGSGEGLASIKSYIVNFGFIGTAIIYFPILLVTMWNSYKTKNKMMMFYILITFASLYQRPYLFWNSYLIMFICGLSYTDHLFSSMERKHRQSDYVKS